MYVIEQLIEYGVVPVLRTRSAANAERAVEWLAEAGFRTFEITLTTPNAVALIGRLAARRDLLIGAGTVLDAEAARAATGAGARYLVSPCVLPELVAPARAADASVLMGAMTPTEVLAAWRAGSSAVKLFPGASVGPAHLKALKSVFPDVPIMPTGGVGAGNLAAWVAAGAACVGVGGKLVDEAAIEAGDRATVVSAGQALLTAWNTVRKNA